MIQLSSQLFRSMEFMGIVEQAVRDITYRDWKFRIRWEGMGPDLVICRLRVVNRAPDSQTGAPGKFQQDTELAIPGGLPEKDLQEWIVNAVFLAIRDREDHETREFLIFKGTRPLYPHNEKRVGV